MYVWKLEVSRKTRSANSYAAGEGGTPRPKHLIHYCPSQVRGSCKGRQNGNHRTYSRPWACNDILSSVHIK